MISAEIGAAKPGREIFDTTFGRLDSPARQTAIILGDSLSSDMRGGAEYGIATCWYNPRDKPASTDLSVTYEIERLDQFPGVLCRDQPPQVEA